MSAEILFATTARGRDNASLVISDLADQLAASGVGEDIFLYAVTVTASPTAAVSPFTPDGDGDLQDMVWDIRSEETLTYEAPSSLDSSDSPDSIFLTVRTWFCFWPNTAVPTSGDMTTTFAGTVQDSVFIIIGVSGASGFDEYVNNPNAVINDTGDAVIAQSFSNGIAEEAGGILLSVIATSGPTDPVPDAESTEVVAVETATIESEESTTPLRVSLMKIDLPFGSSGWLLGTDNAVRNWILISDGVATGVFESPGGLLPAVTVVAIF
jgi:hypothetical protein